MSNILSQMQSSNADLKKMMDDPAMQEFFETDKPELNALLDITKIAADHEVMGKWVAKKLPVIGYVELAIDLSYNGLDWYKSYERLCEAQKINGKVLETAKGIQKNIDNTFAELSRCNQ